MFVKSYEMLTVRGGVLEQAVVMMRKNKTRWEEKDSKDCPEISEVEDDKCAEVSELDTHHGFSFA